MYVQAGKGMPPLPLGEADGTPLLPPLLYCPKTDGCAATQEMLQRRPPPR